MWLLTELLHGAGELGKYLRETPVMKESLLDTRQHKKEGDDNSRSAKYYNKLTTKQPKSTKQTANPSFYFPPEKIIHTVKHRENGYQCLH